MIGYFSYYGYSGGGPETLPTWNGYGYGGQALAMVPRRVDTSDSPPGTQAVVTLDDVKHHLRVDHNDDDDYIQTLIDVAVSHVGGFYGILGRSLVTETWEVDFGCFPADGKLRLPFPDVITADEVTYKDSDGADQVVDAASYVLLEDVVSSYLSVGTGSWPAGTAMRPDAVTVRFTAGFGTASQVPPAIKHALRLMIGDWYEQRETVAVGVSATTIPLTAPVARLLANYKHSWAVA